MEFCRLKNKPCANATPFGGCMASLGCNYSQKIIDTENISITSSTREEKELENLTEFRTYLINNIISNDYLKTAYQARQIALIDELIIVTKLKIEKI